MYLTEQQTNKREQTAARHAGAFDPISGGMADTQKPPLEPDRDPELTDEEISRRMERDQAVSEYSAAAA
jgi:hypothetical protein